MTERRFEFTPTSAVQSARRRGQYIPCPACQLPTAALLVPPHGRALRAVPGMRLGLRRPDRPRSAQVLRHRVARAARPRHRPPPCGGGLPGPAHDRRRRLHAPGGPCTIEGARGRALDARLHHRAPGRRGHLGGRPLRRRGQAGEPTADRVDRSRPGRLRHRSAARAARGDVEPHHRPRRPRGGNGPRRHAHGGVRQHEGASPTVCSGGAGGVSSTARCRTTTPTTSRCCWPAPASVGWARRVCALGTRWGTWPHASICTRHSGRCCASPGRRLPA